MKDVEADRLKDEAVRTALIAEQARRKRETDRKRLLNAPTPTSRHRSIRRPSTPVQPSDNGGDSGTTRPIADRARRRDPRCPSGGGGQTGGGGNGSFPGGGGNDYAGPGWVCPTGSSPAPFADTWGAPRSGGRRHQGVDMIGQRGIPVLAVVDGVAEAEDQRSRRHHDLVHRRRRQQYYYAHLDELRPARGRSRPARRSGTSARRGMRSSASPHLHFEIHPGGGPPSTRTRLSRPTAPRSPADDR